MFTRIITLKLPGRGVITATVTAGDPTTHFPVHYTGPAATLPGLPSATSPNFLKIHLDNLVSDLGGTLEIADSGDYDLFDE